MIRRQILSAGAAFAMAPLLIRPAMAQTAAASAAGATAVPQEKQPMVAAGTYSKMTSELARTRATAAPLKTFAGLEVAEQTAVATAFGAADGPPIMTRDQNDKLEALRAADAGSFDMMYLDDQIVGHETLLTLARDYAAKGTDPMAQGAAMVAVPSIETHLVMLRGIKASMA